MSHYLMKRNSIFAKDGILIKSDKSSKGYTDIVKTKSKTVPFSKKNLEIGDTIWISEGREGIYATLTVTELGELIELDNPSDVISFVEKMKSDPYCVGKMYEFNNRYKENPNYRFKYFGYSGKQKALPRVIPFNDVLARFVKKGDANVYNKLTESDLEYLRNPDFTVALDDFLSPKIPGKLKMASYGFFGTNHNLGKIVDIDHFIPRSVGGPGNIIENLVPIGFSFNRSKSDSIPRIFFEIAKVEFPELSTKIDKILKDTSDVIKKSKNPKSHLIAHEITSLVSAKGMEYAKKFYFECSSKFYPTWTEYRKTWIENNK